MRPTRRGLPRQHTFHAHPSLPRLPRRRAFVLRAPPAPWSTHLSVDVAAERDRCIHSLHVSFFHEDLGGPGAQLLHLTLFQRLAAPQSFDPRLHVLHAVSDGRHEWTPRVPKVVAPTTHPWRWREGAWLGQGREGVEGGSTPRTKGHHNQASSVRGKRVGWNKTCSRAYNAVGDAAVGARRNGGEEASPRWRRNQPHGNQCFDPFHSNATPAAAKVAAGSMGGPNVPHIRTTLHQ